MAQTLTVTSLDEAFINLASKVIMSVQFEVRVSGTLEEERLRGALRQAVATHPLARARLAPPRLSSTRVTWEIADSADHLALEVTDEPVGVVRDRLQSRAPDLARSPLFHVALVRHPGGDYLMFNFHHAGFDGMGAVRFLTSVARAYSGAEDIAGGPPIEEARDLRAIAGARSFSDVIPRAQKLAQDTMERKRVTRVASDGGDPAEPGYTFAAVTLTAEQTAGIVASKPKGATINDVALAAQALTVLRWNEAHGEKIGDSVSIMMPVNMRPAEWSTEVISNYASFLAIVVPTSVPRDLAEATMVVRDRTKKLKENGAAGWIVDVLDRGNMLPVILKKNLASMLPLVQHQFVETTVLSNVGRMSLPGFGDAGEVTEVWFSPPCFGDVMSPGVGLAGVGKELFVTFRGIRKYLSNDAVQRFADLYVETITGG
ncbi:condensation domain-containing protein [Lolliginicoccus suaedae]|uniref:condensation domain-containing protein n=1 Tax=Lolliginicoccus suaedae TaxID=2605429 RepID=UPI0011ECC3D4|nr:condensation domain-containing protein [Lolliginicoccus suaedae]